MLSQVQFMNPAWWKRIYNNTADGTTKPGNGCTALATYSSHWLLLLQFEMMMIYELVSWTSGSGALPTVPFRPFRWWWLKKIEFIISIYETSGHPTHAHIFVAINMAPTFLAVRLRVLLSNNDPLIGLNWKASEFERCNRPLLQLDGLWECWDWTFVKIKEM